MALFQPLDIRLPRWLNFALALPLVILPRHCVVMYHQTVGQPANVPAWGDVIVVAVVLLFLAHRWATVHNTNPRRWTFPGVLLLDFIRKRCPKQSVAMAAARELESLRETTLELSRQGNTRVQIDNYFFWISSWTATTFVMRRLAATGVLAVLGWYVTWLLSR